jgi:hypothetical protein
MYGTPAVGVTVLAFCVSQRIFFGKLPPAKLVLHVFREAADYVSDVLWYHFQLTGFAFKAAREESTRSYHNNNNCDLCDAADEVGLTSIILAGLVILMRFYLLFGGFEITKLQAKVLLYLTLAVEDIPMFVLQVQYFITVGFDGSDVLTIVTYSFTLFSVVTGVMQCCCGMCCQTDCLLCLPTSDKRSLGDAGPCCQLEG